MHNLTRHNNPVTEMATKSQETNEVEPFVSPDTTVHIVNQTHNEENNPLYDEPKRVINHVDKIKEVENETIARQDKNSSSKQCPDNLLACLEVCEPIKSIRELAYILCQKECRKRCSPVVTVTSTMVP